MNPAKIPTLSRYWWLQSRGFWLYVIVAVGATVIGALLFPGAIAWWPL